MPELKKYQFILYTFLSTLLLSIPWIIEGTSLMLLIAFVPLLLIEDYFYEKREFYRPIRVFFQSLVVFSLFTLIVLWGLATVSVTVIVSVTIFTSLMMSTIIWLFHIVKRKLGRGFGYFALIVFWICYEYFYQEGELNFAWLNLGNAFGSTVSLVQWYEYTGVFGGTFWVLLSNIIFYHLIRYYILSQKEKLPGQVFILCFTVLAPIVASLIIYYNYSEKSDPRRIVILQPNYDPYVEKFEGVAIQEQMDRIISLAESKITPQTDYVVAPETSIPEGIWLNELNDHKHILRVKSFVESHPRVKFIIGLNTLKMYANKESATTSAHRYEDTDQYFDYYNSAIQIDTSDSIQLYHKSLLLTGTEKVPYSRFFGFMEDLIIDAGGFVGSNGVQEERSVFTASADSLSIAPVICYESVFGQYISDYIKKGASLIFIITNDGWWGDSPIYRQHLSYSRLRAIEMRRSIARSANTGISCFINQRGYLLQPTEGWTMCAFEGEINANREITFYAENGDFIPRIAIFFGVIVLLYTLTKIGIMGKKKY